MIQAVDQDRAVVGDRFNAVVCLELFDESAELGQMRIQCFDQVLPIGVGQVRSGRRYCHLRGIEFRRQLGFATFKRGQLQFQCCLVLLVLQCERFSAAASTTKSQARIDEPLSLRGMNQQRTCA
ncbi:hypothetical protein D3C76_1296690 [compost metagenome]